MVLGPRQFRGRQESQESIVIYRDFVLMQEHVQYGLGMDALDMVGSRT